MRLSLGRTTSPAPMRSQLCRHAGSPPSARHTLSARKTTATGRSPGLRVSAGRPPSRNRGPNGAWPMARRVQLQGQPGFSRSLLVPVAGEPVACRRR
ncbi:hypothetical protein SC1_00071 [Sphingopyxis sp. C-1]|nr:hypothetical protein SC1_00071 [Sphingopyxis sp. C-1]